MSSCVDVANNWNLLGGIDEDFMDTHPSLTLCLVDYQKYLIQLGVLYYTVMQTSLGRFWKIQKDEVVEI